MVFGNFFKIKQQQNQCNEKQDIYEEKEVKIKGKRRKRTSASTTDIDTSGILAQPFPPMFSRAKSPSDILDFVGYPKPIPSPGLIHNNSNNNNNNNNKDGISPMAYYQLPMTFNIPLTIRNKTPEKSTAPSPINSPDNNSNNNNNNNINNINNNKSISHSTTSSSSTMIYSQNRATLSSPSLLQMPTPKKVIPPTRRILNADQNDKTLVLEDQPTTKKAISLDEVEYLRQQMKEIQLERQDWIRLEKERRKVEEDLLRTIKENQDKIKELSLQQGRQIQHQQKQQQRQLNLLKYKVLANPLPLSTPSYTQDDEESENDNNDQIEDSFYYENPSFNENDHSSYYDAGQHKHPFYQQPIYFSTEDIETPRYISSHHSESSSGYYSDEEDEENSYEEEEEAYYYPMLSSSAIYHPHWQGQQRSLPPPSTQYMDMDHFWPCPTGSLTNDILVSPLPIRRNSGGYSQVPPPSMMNPPPPRWFHRPHSTRYMIQQYNKSLSSSPILRRHHSLGDNQFNI
ncbi:hypothetical protein BJ944DRAFT_99584 [Cunninghamella echinulata]|nr:hypothetical protein BJ944DRAFT_99584 [Cunninghamella echinulata]